MFLLFESHRDTSISEGFTETDAFIGKSEKVFNEKPEVVETQEEITISLDLSMNFEA